MDCDGHQRVFPTEGSVDIGAYEYSANLVCSPGEARKFVQDGQTVYLIQRGAMTVTAKFREMSAFYVEESDRTSGIQCRSNSLLDPGQTAIIYGTMAEIDGERVLVDADVYAGSLSTAQIPGALGMNNRSLGGGAFGLQQAISGSFGLNNIGLLVRTWGVVTASGLDPRGWATWFYLDDGSKIQDGTGITGVYVRFPSGTPVPAVGVHLRVTGISSCEVYNWNLVNVLLPRTTEDIVVSDGGIQSGRSL
jgi:hypothetical protein